MERNCSVESGKDVEKKKKEKGLRNEERSSTTRNVSDLLFCTRFTLVSEKYIEESKKRDENLGQVYLDLFRNSLRSILLWFFFTPILPAFSLSVSLFLPRFQLARRTFRLRASSAVRLSGDLRGVCRLLLAWSLSLYLILLVLPPGLFGDE